MDAMATPRDSHRLDQWKQLIKAEYNEVPGLRLTKPQVQRLWGLDSVTCDALLVALEGDHFLRRTRKDSYVRHDLDQ
jgi:hypothetical protein